MICQTILCPLNIAFPRKRGRLEVNCNQIPQEFVYVEATTKMCLFLFIIYFFNFGALFFYSVFNTFL